MQKRRYQAKMSGPLLDRVDLRVPMHTVRAGAFAAEQSESSAEVRARVAAARAAAAQRWSSHGFTTNAEVSGTVLRTGFRIGTAAMAPLKTALDRGLLSIRGAHRLMRVAWTVADLGGRVSPSLDDVSIALSFRQAEIKP
jgi:magnesium chelatase family protein